MFSPVSINSRCCCCAWPVPPLHEYAATVPSPRPRRPAIYASSCLVRGWFPVARCHLVQPVLRVRRGVKDATAVVTTNCCDTIFGHTKAPHIFGVAERALAGDLHGLS